MIIWVGKHNFPSGTYHLNEESSHDPDSENEGVKLCDSGTYHLNEKLSHYPNSEIEGVKVCDNHKCCISSHIALELAMCDHTYSKEIIKFHKDRPIYTKKDEFNGNFDICYLCINDLPSENVSNI